jgi:hypothetical protein
LKINIVSFNKNILVVYFFCLVLLPYSKYFPLRYEDILLGILFLTTIMSSKKILQNIIIFSIVILFVLLIQLLVYMLFNDGYIYVSNLQRALLYIKITITYLIIETILSKFELKQRLNIYRNIFYFLFISLILGYLITFNIFGVQEIGKYYLGTGAAREVWMDRIRDLTYEFRMLGLFGNPNMFAFSISLMLSYYILIKNNSSYFMDLFIFSISIIAIFLSGSRTALVTILVLLILYYFLKFMQNSTIKKLLFLFLGFTFIAIVIININNYSNSDYVSVARLLEFDRYSFGGRGKLWDEQLNYITSNNLINFLIGYGPLKELANTGTLPLFSDSQFIGILKNFGFIIFLLFILLVGFIIKRLFLKLNFNNENYFNNKLFISVIPIIISMITIEILFNIQMVILIMPFIFETFRNIKENYEKDINYK